MSKLYPISVEGEAQFGNLIYHTLRTFLVNPSNSVVSEGIEFLAQTEIF